jgi:diguanylate cyclase (GGDEF)-like protein/PAS domain S-box-containing protein
LQPSRDSMSTSSEKILTDLLKVIDRMSDGLTVSDFDGHFEIFNKKMYEITGWTKEEANEEVDFNSLIYLTFKDREEAVEGLNEVRDGREIFEAERIILSKEGVIKNIAVSTSLIQYKDKNMFLTVWRDITEAKKLQRILERSESRYRRLFETAQEGIILISSITSKVLDVNQFLVDLTGYSPNEITGRKLWELGFIKDVKKSKEAFDRLQTTGFMRDENFPLEKKSGDMINAEFISNSYVIDGEKIIQCSLRDVTDRKKLNDAQQMLYEHIELTNKKLKEMTVKDSLTGLYNYRYLEETIDKDFNQAKRLMSFLSIIMMDLDFFKSINDVYGHVMGDRVLKQFAQELQHIVRPYDMVIRYGGEEFLIVSPQTSRLDALALAKRIIDQISFFVFGDEQHEIKLKLSLGVSSYPEDQVSNGLDLIKLADDALTKAKEKGGNSVCSSSDAPLSADIDEKIVNVQSLKDKISKLTKRSNQSLVEAVFAFAKVLKAKDNYTGEHVDQSAYYTGLLASAMGLPKEQVEAVKQAASLHDLGKVGISDKILNKKGKLTSQEFQEIKKHPQIAADILRPIRSLHPIIPMVLYHHESWNGQGYPLGLKGKEIPLGARIVAVAEVYQALISNRPYRKGYSKERAIKIVKELSGSKFDPDIVKTFTKSLKENEEFAVSKRF